MSRIQLPRGEFTRALSALRRVFWQVGGVSLVINLLMLAPALYMLQTYDRVLISRNENTLLVLTALLAGLLVLEAALEYLRSLVMSRASARLDIEMGPKLFDAAFEHRLSRQGSLGQTLTDHGHVRGFITGKGFLAFFDAPWLPVYLGVTFLIHPVLGWFGLASALTLLALAMYNEHATGALQVEVGRMGNAAHQMADTSARNAEVVDALGMLAIMRQRWLKRQHQYLATLGDMNQRAACISAVVRFARTFLQSAILGLGAYFVLQDQMTAGGMIAASILLGRALAPVDQIIGHWRQFITAIDALKRLNEVLDAPVVYPPKVKLPRPKGLLQAENLVVSAPGKKEPILKGLGFEVRPGQLVAIVGASGSGKSTLARALMGVWKPLSGSVRLDGADLAHAWREDIGPYLGYLPQDIELFAGTLAENIARFGVIDSDAVVLAAQRAGMHELILRLPQGYETRILDGSPVSVTLSAGQRQRVALARALYSDPVLLVLDEPNASLDEAGDLALLNALGDLRVRGCTVFVVTHRYNLLSQVDTIMVLSEGRIQTMGAAADVLKAQQQRIQPGAGSNRHVVKSVT